MGTPSKALSLLQHFTRERPSIGLSDLARLSGLNKATCHRLLTELLDHGLAEQAGPAREYRIGPAVLRLAALREAAVPTRDAALPLLQALATRTGETAHLSHLVAGRLEALAHAYGATHGMQVLMEDADLLPFHATASGLATLAFLPDPEPILASPLPPRTGDTPTTPEALRERIAQVRAQGWAATRDTFEAGVSSVAVPLFDPHGACRGALALAVPTLRMTPDAQARALREVTDTAPRIMALWGAAPPPDLLTLWRALDPERTPA